MILSYFLAAETFLRLLAIEDFLLGERTLVASSRTRGEAAGLVRLVVEAFFLGLLASEAEMK